MNIKKYRRGICKLCFKKSNTHVHHINCNRNDNSELNLIEICLQCHNKLHSNLLNWIKHNGDYLYMTYPNLDVCFKRFEYPFNYEVNRSVLYFVLFKFFKDNYLLNYQTKFFLKVILNKKPKFENLNFTSKHRFYKYYSIKEIPEEYYYLTKLSKEKFLEIKNINKNSYQIQTY